jgi:hypothetical protein
MDNYSPVATIGHGLFWQRKSQPWRQPSEAFQNLAAGDDSSVLLPVVSIPGPDRIGVVRVHYRISNRLAFLPLLGRTPRYLVSIEGSPRHLTVSFSPDVSEFQFPVQLPFGKAVRLRFRTDSLLPGVTFLPYEVQFKMLDWDPAEKAIYAKVSQEAPE